jgi:hypothetical protein
MKNPPVERKRYAYVNDASKIIHKFIIEVSKNIDFEVMKKHFSNYVIAGRTKENTFLIFRKDLKEYLEKTYFKYSKNDIEKLRLPLKLYKENNDFFGFLNFCMSVKPEEKIKLVKMTWNDIDELL